MLSWLRSKLAALRQRWRDRRQLKELDRAERKREGLPPRRLITKRKVIQAVYFVGTVSIASFCLWAFLPTWLAAFLMVTIMTHEFGHYFTASLSGRVALLPFFIPIPYFGVVGATHVKGHEPETDTRIALAGPLAGSLLVIGAMGAFFAVGFMPGFWAGFWMLAFQVYSGLFGGDGRRYRRARREILVVQEAQVLAI